MSNQQEQKNVEFALEKSNYILMGIGLLIIVLGLILMIGGRSDDPKVFNESMFSFQRITLAPLLILGGLVFEFYAIMKRPKRN